MEPPVVTTPAREKLLYFTLPLRQTTFISSSVSKIHTDANRPTKLSYKISFSHLKPQRVSSLQTNRSSPSDLVKFSPTNISSMWATFSSQLLLQILLRALRNTIVCICEYNKVLCIALFLCAFALVHKLCTVCYTDSLQLIQTTT